MLLLFTPRSIGLSSDQQMVYTTTFPLTENPISEGGVWVHQATPWAWFRTLGGLALGTQGLFGNSGNAYNDSHAINQAFPWPANVRVNTIVYRSATISAANHEVEILFRCATDTDSVRCYEVLLNKDGTIQCFKWLDVFEGFSAALTPSGSDSVGSVPNGAAFEAKIVGDIISVFYAAGGGATSLVCTFDINEAGAKWADGDPGIGAFCRPAADGSDPDDFGYQSVTITEDVS